MSSRRKTDNRCLLTSDQADETSFPEGCCVVHNFQSSNSITNARKGIVKSVSLNTDKKQFEFQIERSDSASSESILDDVVEDDIAYAIHCPVMIKSTCASSGSEDGLEGQILFVKPVNDGNGNKRMSYIVEYVTEGNVLRMEEGVTSDRISFNRKMISDHKADTKARGEGPLIAKEKSTAPPVVVPNLSPGSSRKGSLLNDSERLEKTSGKGAVDCPRGQNEKYVSPTSINERTKTHKAKSPTDNLQPQLNIYVQKPTHKMDSETKNILLPRFDGATSPLTCDFSDSGTDRHVQQKMNSYQPSDPSKKRSATASFIEHPSALSKVSEAPCVRPKKSLKTEMTDHASLRKHGPNVRKLGNALVCEMTVPLWVNYGAEDLFLHLLGVGKTGKRGCKTYKIRLETGCKVNFSRCNPERGIPMKILIRQSDINPRKNIEKAITMVEDSLFLYMGENSANGRLFFEMRAGSLDNSLVSRTQSGAVQTHHDRWMQLLELSCVKMGLVINSGRNKQLDRKLLHSVWDNTKCSVELFEDCPDRPLKLCKPYVIVQGRELEWVERAAAMITDAKRQSMTRDQDTVDDIGIEPKVSACLDGDAWVL